LGIPVLPGDQLRFDCFGDATYGVRFNVNIRNTAFTPDGVITTGYTNAQQDVNILTPLTTANTFKTLISTGEIESASVEASGTGATGTPPVAPGRLYCVAWLVRGGTFLCRLLSGYFSSRSNPSYPGLQVNPGDGPGFINTVAGTAPAVATDISDLVPSTTRWRLKAIEAVLVTDANAANRTVNLFIDDAAGTPTRRIVLTDATAQTATLTRTHAWYPGTDNFNTASVSLTDTVTLLAKFPMLLQDPGIYLTGGDRIRTVTALIQAGDQWSAARYWIESWVGIS